MSRLLGPAAMPREISSRSTELSTLEERRLMVGVIPPVDSSTPRTAEPPRPRGRPIPRIDSPALYMRLSSVHWESVNNRRRPPLMRHLLVVRLQPRCFADRLRPPNPCVRYELSPMSQVGQVSFNHLPGPQHCLSWALISWCPELCPPRPAMARKTRSSDGWMYRIATDSD